MSVDLPRPPRPRGVRVKEMNMSDMTALNLLQAGS